MSALDLMAVLATLTALLAYFNARVLQLAPAIGVTIIGLLVSLTLMGLSRLGFGPAQDATRAITGLDFSSFVFQGVLSLLLFAGALGVNTGALWQMRVPVLAFAIFSTAASIAMVGFGLIWLLGLVGTELPLVYGLLFGALISPTDPVAVLGMLKKAKVPERIETLVAGESLLNDGVAVVAFTVLAAVAAGGHGGHAPDLSIGGLSAAFATEALGGLALGAALGGIGLLLIRRIHEFSAEVLITLAVVLVCTALAFHLHVSAPLAAVAAGLLIGIVTDHRPGHFSDHERFEEFWHLLDELANIALFSLLALEIAGLTITPAALTAGLIAIPAVLVARAISVQLPVMLLGSRNFVPFTRRLMVWGGLRGAISVALAFSLPAGEQREVLLLITYIVVVFSIIVQGLTTPRLAQMAARSQGEGAA